LSEGHRQILIPARQLSVVAIAIIASDTFLELDVGEMGDQLSENGSAGFIHHCSAPGRSAFPADTGRFQLKSFLAQCQLNA
jgi:hypothetical protein